MKTTRSFIARNLFILSAVVLASGGWHVNAQTSAPTLQAAPVPARITAAIDETQLVPLKGFVHPAVRASFDQGPLSGSTPATRVLLMLQRSPDQEAALSQLMIQQQDKTSPNYHAWLTPQQFAAQFGPADSDVQAITGWLQSHGFQNIKVGAGKTTIEFSGNVAQLTSAFHTEIHNLLFQGQHHVSNVSDPQIPVALGPVVSGVMGLNDFHPKSFMHTANNYHPEVAALVKNGPNVTFTGCGTGGTGECYGVAPADFAKIYNVPTAVNGTGVTIAIVQDSNINVSDVQQFRQLFSLSNNFTTANVILNGQDPGVQGDEGEADLDAEWAGAVAQGATINLVVSESPETLGANGIDLSALFIIDNNLAPIISESFGVCELATGVNAFYDALWEQAAAQGISVFVSTGDNGSDVCDQLTAAPNDFATSGVSISGLASTPFNTAVGGTDFQNGPSPSVFWATTNNTAPIESALSYIPESTWNSSCAATAASGNLGTCTAAIVDADISAGDFLEVVAGSGGQSGVSTNTKPAYQVGITPAGDTLRDIPDISLYSAVNTSNNAFYIMCEQDSGAQNGNACALAPGQPVEITGVGGTSAAAPAFAGIMALVIQQQGGQRQGNANFVLYQLYKKDTGNATLICPSNTANVTTTTCVFYDTIVGNNSIACAGGSPNCGNTTAASGNFGVLVDPANTSNPAYTAVAGYDKATGLGSVNVTNLLAAWSSASFTSDTVALTGPSGTLAHGANANFTVTVTSGSGTPTGFVSLVATPPTGETETIGSFTTDTNNSFQLSSGTVTISTNLLPGGSPVSVVAAYSGDGTFAPGKSPAVSVNVTPENSATQVNLVNTNGTATSVSYGSGYVLRVDVVGTGNGGGNPCTSQTVAIPCPSGSVSITANGSPLNDFSGGNTATLLNDLGFLEDQNIQLTAGSYSIVASYAGDSSYNASTSPADNVTVTKATTTTTVSSSATTITSGASVTLTAAIATTSDGAGPTGTVTFSACGTPPCTATVVGTAANFATGTPASATATLTTTFNSAGTQTISATFSGDKNYANSATTTSVTITVQGSGSFALGSSPLTLSSATGAAAGSTITVTPSGGFTGNVVVTANSLPVGVTCPSSPLTINVTGTTAVTGTLNCQVLATSATLTASDFRDNKTIGAKALPATPARPNVGKGWWALSAGTGFATLLLVFLPGGRKRLRAALGIGLACLFSFALGCGGNGGSQQPPPTLTPTTTKLTVTNGSNGRIASGTAFTFSVSVTGGSPTGMVQLFDGTTMIGAAAAVSGGTATPTAPALSVGTHQISAHYLGDSQTAASQSGMLNLTATGSTTITITTNPAATPAASPITVTVQ